MQSAPSGAHEVPRRGLPAGQPGTVEGASQCQVTGPSQRSTGYFVQFVHSHSEPL